MVNFDKRIEYLIDRYGVFMLDEYTEIITQLESEGYEVSTVSSSRYGDDPIAVFGTKISNEDKKRFKSIVRISDEVLAAMIAADPTPNKMYLQWMLTIFTKLIKDGDFEAAIRLTFEDLPQANEYLELFDGNKRKRLFKELSSKNYALKHIEDPTNINQYKNLAQLFDAVDPFIEREPSKLEKAMQQFVDAGQALIPVKDRNFTLFIPLSRDANVLFNKFASWCTARPENGMFNSYTNYKTPTSDKSKIYIIIDNKFLSGEFDNVNGIPNDMLYQLHFESQQLRDRSNGPNRNIYNNVFAKSEALSNFFYEELMPNAKAYKGSIKNNIYVNYLIDFGFTDILFDMLDTDVPGIRFQDRAIPKLPDLKRFKNVEFLFLGNTSTKELTPTIASMPKLAVLSIPSNKITSLPREIGQCKKLTFINVLGNTITSIPDELSELDKTNGGRLHRMAVRKADIGEQNYERLKKLLPSVMLTEAEL